MSNPDPCRIVPGVYVPISNRISAAQNLRNQRAFQQAQEPLADQPCNNDETDFPRVANFSKGLAHDNFGVAQPAAYTAFQAALTEKRVCSFDAHLEDPQTNPTTEQLGTVPVTPTPPGNALAYEEVGGTGAPMGPHGARLLLDNPLAAQSFTLEGGDPQVVGIFNMLGATGGQPPQVIPLPAPPKFNTKTEAAEIAENYWMALLRDVPFKYYTAAGRTEDVNSGVLSPALASQVATLVDAAVSDLGGPNLGFYFGQGYIGGSTEGTLFRGFTYGDQLGPYVSQFFVRPIPEGRLTNSPKIKTAAMRTNYGGNPSSAPNQGGRDYMTTFAEWLSRQRGFVPAPAPQNTLNPYFDTALRLIRSGRDAAEYVHADVVFQEYLNACFILFAPPADRSTYPRDQVYQDLDPTGTVLPFAGGLFDPAQTLAPEIPYQFSKLEKGFITFGNHDLKTMICEVARLALMTVWYYKWNLHRRLRPEAYAGRIDAQYRQHGGPYPFTSSLAALLTNVGGRISTYNGANPQDTQYGGGPPEASYLLPMAFPEGSPVHPSYGAGHATVAGACVTVMKALLNDDLPLSSLLRTDSSGNQSTFFTPVQPTADGTALTKYNGSDASYMTIGSELDKLASNVSLFRNHAGVHWRSDHTYSLLLGQAVALRYLCDIVNTYAEEGSGTDSYGQPPAACAGRPFISLTLRTFEGTRVRIASQTETNVADCLVVVQQEPGGPDLTGIYTPNYT